MFVRFGFGLGVFFEYRVVVVGFYVFLLVVLVLCKNGVVLCYLGLGVFGLESLWFLFEFNLFSLYFLLWFFYMEIGELFFMFLGLFGWGVAGIDV